MNIKLLIFSIFLLLLMSCSKTKDNSALISTSIKVVKNSAQPSKPDFRYVFTEEAVIPFSLGKGYEDRNFERPSFVVTDDSANIYIAGAKTAKIFKFNSAYKFIKSFGGKGGGPGEFQGGPASLTYHKGKLLAPCYQTTITNVYNENGVFIKQISPKLRAGFSGQLSFNNNMFMNIEDRRPEKSEVLIKTSIALIDSNLSVIKKNIYQKDSKTKHNCCRISDMYVRFAAGKDILYIGDISEQNYTVFGYNKFFDKVLEIKKRYKAEIEDDENATVYQFSKGSLGGGFYKKKESRVKNRKLYYKSINHLFVDNYDRLWVISPTKNKNNKDGLFVDIFENGKFLNSINLPFYKSTNFSYVYSSIFMRRSKLFYIDREKECIRVYSYKNK